MIQTTPKVCYFYRPQRSCGKVMFLHLSVILFTGRGVCHTSPWADTTLGRHHPLAQCMLGYGQQAGGTHPTEMHSCANSLSCGLLNRKEKKRKLDRGNWRVVVPVELHLVTVLRRKHQAQQVRFIFIKNIDIT